MATEYGRYVYDRLLEAGAEHGAVPVGLGAFESLRIEKGYRFSGVDMHTDYTPDEAGLGFTVHLTKPSFVGREAVLRERARGLGEAPRADRAGRPRCLAARRRADPGRRHGRGLRDERQLRLLGRREHRLRLPAGRPRRTGAARDRAHLRPRGRRRRSRASRCSTRRASACGSGRAGGQSYVGVRVCRDGCDAPGQAPRDAPPTHRRQRRARELPVVGALVHELRDAARDRQLRHPDHRAARTSSAPSTRACSSSSG